MTVEGLLRLPDDGMWHELIAGEPTTMPPRGFEHGRRAARFAVSLTRHVLAHGRGEVPVAETAFFLACDSDCVRAPDVAFVSRERVQAAGAVTGYWLGAPDLAAEVISPGDLYSEVEGKVVTWLAHGVRMVLVLTPRRRTVSVHRPDADVRHLTEDDTHDGEAVVPGWRVPVRGLFATDG